ncbi:MAG: sigma-70 family RNA polymerase sigma factor [Planctomycetota bacterium]
MERRTASDPRSLDPSGRPLPPGDRFEESDRRSPSSTEGSSSATEALALRRELERLAGLAAGGDELAFECLHRGLGDRVRAFFRRRFGGQPELVEELAQRTWIEVWRSLQKGHFDPTRAAFSTYLLGIGSKVFLRHCRTEKRGRDRLERAERAWGPGFGLDPSAASDATNETEKQLDLTVTLEALHDCVERARTSRRLTELDAKILEQVIEGRTEREIAAQLGVAPSTVNARKLATIGMLRRCLARKGIR